jgi:hypothetical protein
VRRKKLSTAKSVGFHAESEYFQKQSTSEKEKTSTWINKIKITTCTHCGCVSFLKTGWVIWVVFKPAVRLQIMHTEPLASSAAKLLLPVPKHQEPCQKTRCCGWGSGTFFDPRIRDRFFQDSGSWVKPILLRA